MPAKPLSIDEAERTVAIYNECVAEGFLTGVSPGGRGNLGAKAETARRLGKDLNTTTRRLQVAVDRYGLKLDEAVKPRFTFDDLPHDGEETAEELIAALTRRHATRKAHHDAAKLRQVQVNIDGPIMLAFFGDPHVDDPGCAWGDLERDVRLCRETEGVLAVDVGDDSNNWVGRLAKLYAHQEITAKQSLKLIEWLMGSLPWLLRIKGNHDNWNTEKGDVSDYIHRLFGQIGGLEESGARLELNMPSGAAVRLHVRHDFPGGSQFNPAHALVRETLFGHRDHILACGHRHTTGYIPIWHNDPRRLCHGFRVGAYKDFDHYAKEKGFQEGNWARSLAAVIDPDHIGDPVRYIKPFFSLEDATDYLTWRRGKWSVGKMAA
jgi:hypothetical protein